MKEPLQLKKLEIHKPNYKLISIFESYCPVDKYNKVLEIGAGAGIDASILRKLGYDITCIGFGDKNIEYAKTKFGIDIKQIDMHDMTFDDKSFDSIISIQTFEHSTIPTLAVKEMYRVLRKGGRVLIDVPDAHDVSMWTLAHPNLMLPFQLKLFFKLRGFKTIADLSRKHRTTIIFEKF